MDSQLTPADPPSPTPRVVPKGSEGRRWPGPSAVTKLRWAGRGSREIRPDDAALAASIWGLHDRAPELSAVVTLESRQRLVLGGLAGVLLVAMGAAPVGTLVVLMAVSTACYLIAMSYRVVLLRDALRSSNVIVISDDEARAIRAADLPVYTILVPAYREPEQMAPLLRGIDALEYPPHKMDVKLLLEADDAATIAAATKAHPGTHVEIVLVPVAEPRTKPKACNYGLATARGEFVTIYDAEDSPEPLQLRRAVAAFRRPSADFVCLQAKLTFHNAGQNLITRWFTTEYAMWFSFFLPGLINRRAPLPLGGTSNHLRHDVLQEVGGWDPFNVTEDADLGIRLCRKSWKVAVLDSTTQEEANSDFINWAKQRSRWYKGYLQTWLVHMRRPMQLWRDLGAAGFFGFTLFVAGTPVLAVLNPVFWMLTVAWFTTEPSIVQKIFPAWVYYPALASWAFGNFMFIYGNMISARATGRPELVMSAILSPLYWIMMSLAAAKAFIQLLTAPSYWEKTTHGLPGSQRDGEEAGSRAS